MTEFIKPSLRKMYDEINQEIERMRNNIITGKGAATITEEEKIALSVENSKQFRRLVYEKLGR